MSRTLRAAGHEALRLFLIEKRKEAGLTQKDVALRLDRHQPFVSDIERGQRRVDVVQLLELADVIGFDPKEALDRLRSPAAGPHPTGRHAPDGAVDTAGPSGHAFSRRGNRRRQS